MHHFASCRHPPRPSRPSRPSYTSHSSSTSPCSLLPSPSPSSTGDAASVENRRREQHPAASLATSLPPTQLGASAVTYWGHIIFLPKGTQPMPDWHKLDPLTPSDLAAHITCASTATHISRAPRAFLPPIHIPPPCEPNTFPRRAYHPILSGTSAICRNLLL